MTIITRMPRADATPDVTRLEHRFNRLLRDVFAPFESPNGDLATTWSPAVDVLEEPAAIRIVAEVPGIAPNEVKISLENNLLTISGAKRQTADERTDQVHRYERSYGTFTRSFTLPATVDPNAITAAYEHGVLTVTLPKAEKARPRQIQVEVTTKEK
ncbi:MAG TPA: Hsp20/alpha crystallin family protein [Gemmatimonadales bacterium]|nr:Hsp20/alpha crystallin family protein [Gemmatimonadales bacterium]